MIQLFIRESDVYKHDTTVYCLLEEVMYINMIQLFIRESDVYKHDTTVY